MKPTLELVIARHSEDLAWLRRVSPTFRITVYDKGDGASGGVPLPNTGREAHSYLHHLAERHDTLADITVFVQGHPFDHAPDLHRRLRGLAEGTETFTDFYWLGFLADTDDPRGRRLFVPWSKNTERRELELESFHRELFAKPGPDQYRFFVGAQFAVTREAAHRHDPAFYRRAASMAAHFPFGPHCFERCWDRVFCEDGTSGRMNPGELTAYFKPIKRLAPSTRASPLVRPSESR